MSYYYESGDGAHGDDLGIDLRDYQDAAFAHGPEAQQTPEEELHEFQESLVAQGLTYELYANHGTYSTPSQYFSSDGPYFFRRSPSDPVPSLDAEVSAASHSRSTSPLEPEQSAASHHQNQAWQCVAPTVPAMGSSDGSFFQFSHHQQDLQRLPIAVLDQAQGAGVESQVHTQERQYFICYKCDHARPHPDQQSPDVHDSCEYCELDTLGADLLHEMKYCINGQHKTMRFDFFDVQGMEHPTACLHHRFPAGEEDAGEFVADAEEELEDAELEEEGESEPEEPETFRQTQPKMDGVTSANRATKSKVLFKVGRAVQENARMRNDHGIVETLYLEPNHTKRDGFLRRRLANKIAPKAIAAIQLYGRGRGKLTKRRLQQQYDTVRQHARVVKKAGFNKKTACPVTNYSTAGMVQRQRTTTRPESDVTLAHIAKYAKVLPTGLEAGVFTQAVQWAQATGNTTARVSDIPTLQHEHGWSWPIDPATGQSVLANPRYDQESVNRVLHEIDQSGFAGWSGKRPKDA